MTDIIFKIAPTVRIAFVFAKTVAYGVLLFFLLSQLIGADGVAKIFQVENPTQEGIEMVNLVIPKYVLQWTVFTVALELLGNLFGIQKNWGPEYEFLTKREYREDKSKQRLDEVKKNLEIK